MENRKLFQKVEILCECCGKNLLEKILWEFCYMVSKSKIIKWKRCLSKSILLLQRKV